jgi:F-type H+-transporting ATPase subunit b
MLRSWFPALLLIPLLLLALAPTTRAAKPESGGDHATAAPASGGAAEASGEGKINVFQGFLDLSIWTLVVFLLLVFILGRFAWKPMLAGLQLREQTIRDSLDKAREEREKAEGLRLQFQREMDQAQDKVRQLMDEARRDAQANQDRMLAQTRGEIQAERDRLHREIDTARDQALHQIWSRAAEVATAISGRVLRRSLTPEEHRRLVDETLAEMPREGNGQRRPAAG